MGSINVPLKNNEYTYIFNHEASYDLKIFKGKKFRVLIKKILKGITNESRDVKNP